MEEITIRLKQARENKGVSLQEVQTATRIPVHYLEVLEGGKDTSFLADRLYLIPFLRSYATFLGISPETAISQFVSELQKNEASTARSERPRESFRFSPWLILLSLFVALLVIFSSIWYGGGIGFLWPGGEEEPPSLSSESPSSLTEPNAPASSLSPNAPASSLTEPNAPASSLTEPNAPPVSSSLFFVETGTREPPLLALSPQISAIGQEAPHLLQVRAKERTWIHATIDGEQERDVLLKPGETVEWSAQKGFVLTIGNAGGADLIFNGKDLPALGVSGEVIRDFQLPPPEEEEGVQARLQP